MTSIPDGNSGGVLAWHWLEDSRRLRYGDRAIVEAGATYTAVGPLVLCENGMHASVKPLDALEYAPGDIVCRVRLSGEIVTGDDKLCARARTVLWLADASRALHEFACWCAERALDGERKAGRKPDPRSVAAIAAKRAWLRGEIGDEDLAAAWAAARDAARDAAWDAARDAARDAAWAAAWAAAWDAAWDAAWEGQNAELTRLLLALAPEGYAETAAVQ